jgi:hypothetical protein
MLSCGSCAEADLVLVFTATNNTGTLGSTPYTVTSEQLLADRKLRSADPRECGHQSWQCSAGNYTFTAVYDPSNSRSQLMWSAQPTATPTATSTTPPPSLTGSGQCVENDLTLPSAIMAGPVAADQLHCLGSAGYVAGGTVPH